MYNKINDMSVDELEQLLERIELSIANKEEDISKLSSQDKLNVRNQHKNIVTNIRRAIDDKQYARYNPSEHRYRTGSYNFSYMINNKISKRQLNEVINSLENDFARDSRRIDNLMENMDMLARSYISESRGNIEYYQDAVITDLKGFQEIEEAYNSDLGVNRIYKLIKDLSYCRDYEELGYSLNQIKRNISELEDLKGELRRALENVINEVVPNIKINDELINEIACEIEEDIDKSLQEYEAAMDVAANKEKGLSDDKNDIENGFLEQDNESSIDKKISNKYSYNNIMNQLAFSGSIELTIDDGVKVTLIKTDKGIIKKTVLENIDVPEIPGGVQKEESLKKIIDKANEFEARGIKVQELNAEVKDKDKVKEKSNEEMFL